MDRRAHAPRAWIDLLLCANLFCLSITSVHAAGTNTRIPDAEARSLYGQTQEADRLSRSDPATALRQLNKLIQTVETRYGADDGLLVDMLRKRAGVTLALYDSDMRLLDAAIADDRRVLDLLRRHPGGDADIAAAGAHAQLANLLILREAPWSDVRAEFEAGVEAGKPGSVQHMLDVAAYASAACNGFDVSRCQSLTAQAQSEALKAHPADGEAIWLDNLAVTAGAQRGDAPAVLEASRRLLARLPRVGRDQQEQALRVSIEPLLHLSELGFDDELREYTRVLNAFIDSRGADTQRDSPSWLDAVSFASGHMAMALAASGDGDGAMKLGGRTATLAQTSGARSGLIMAALAQSLALQNAGKDKAALSTLLFAIHSGYPCANAYARLALLRARSDDANGARDALDNGLRQVGTASICRNIEWLYFADAARTMNLLHDPAAAIALGKIAIERTQDLRRQFGPERVADLATLTDARADIFYDVSGWLSDQQRFDEADAILHLLRVANVASFLRGAASGTVALAPTLRDDETQVRAALNGASSLRDALKVLVRNGQLAASAVPDERRGLRPGDVRVQLSPVAGGTAMLAVLDAPGKMPYATQVLPLPRAQLYSLVARFTERVSQPTKTETQRAAQLADGQLLYRQLWRPLEAQIDAQLGKGGRVVLALYGAAARVPFAALNDGQSYLVDRYVFVRESLEPAAPQPGNARLAGFATNLSVANLPALKNATAEVRDLVVHLGGAKAGNRAWLERQYDRQSLFDVAGSGDYSRIHIASHFLFPSSASQAAYLVLGDGSPLFVTDLGALKFKDTDLLMLSACQVAAPLPINGGESGLTSAADWLRAAGARQVVAAQWQVDDRAAPVLVQGFYDALTARGDGDAATALAQAQRAMLHGAQPNLQDPFTWASFVTFAAPLPATLPVTTR